MKRLLPLAGVLMAATSAPGALVVSLQDITVVAEPAGGSFVTAAMDVFVRNDDPAVTLTSFQMHLKIADEIQRDVVTTGVGETAPRPQLLAGQQSYSNRPDSVTAIYAKFGFAPVPLQDNGGLARVEFAIAPGVEGVYAVNLITSDADPAFGTILIGGDFITQLPYTPVHGSVTVVIPEPAAAAGLLAPAVVLLRRRRARC